MLRMAYTGTRALEKSGSAFFVHIGTAVIMNKDHPFGRLLCPASMLLVILFSENVYSILHVRQ